MTNEIPKGATTKDGKVAGLLIELYEGQWMIVRDSGRQGWWRFHEDCDNPGRGY